MAVLKEVIISTRLGIEDALKVGDKDVEMHAEVQHIETYHIAMALVDYGKLPQSFQDFLDEERQNIEKIR